MKILLSGGSKSGKSMLAQRLTKKLAGPDPLYYLATMVPTDEEDRRRIAQHQADREGWGYTTVECGQNLSSCFDQLDPTGTVLLDSVTALFANEMFGGKRIDRNAAWRTAEALRCLGAHCRHVVYVTDSIFCDAGRYDEDTEAYRRGLAQVDRILAEQCDVVAELCGGIPIVYKGQLP